MDRDGIYQNKLAKKIIQSTLKVEIVTEYGIRARKTILEDDLYGL